MNEIEKAEQIRKRYETETVTELEQLKALDKRARRPAQIFAYAFGSGSSLVLGTGMCLAMKAIGNAMAAGIVIGLVGIGLCLATYPLYKMLLGRRKKKYAAEIIARSNEILKN